MSAATPSHEIDAERETPKLTLVLMRTQEEPRALKLTLRSKYRAEDLVQEARLRAWRRIEDQLIEDQLTNGPSPVEPIDQALTAMDVRAALAQLTPEHRQVIVDMFYLGRSVTEIAQLLSIPERTVLSRGYYGLRRVKRLLSAA